MKIKKRWLIGLSLALAVILVLGGILFLVRPAEPAVTIRYPGGPEYRVVVDLPEQLSISWEQTEIGRHFALWFGEFFSLHLGGTIKNISPQEVYFERVIVIVGGEEISHWSPPVPGDSLEPGEEMKFVIDEDTLRMPHPLERARTIEVKVQGFKVAGQK